MNATDDGFLFPSSPCASTASFYSSTHNQKEHHHHQQQQELQNAFSTLDGMDSFMNDSLVNDFLTDEEFFQMDNCDVFTADESTVTTADNKDHVSVSSKRNRCIKSRTAWRNTSIRSMEDATESSSSKPLLSKPGKRITMSLEPLRRSQSRSRLRRPTLAMDFDDMNKQQNNDENEPTEKKSNTNELPNRSKLRRPTLAMHVSHHAGQDDVSFSNKIGSSNHSSRSERTEHSSGVNSLRSSRSTKSKTNHHHHNESLSSHASRKSLLDELVDTGHKRRSNNNYTRNNNHEATTGQGLKHLPNESGDNNSKRRSGRRSNITSDDMFQSVQEKESSPSVEDDLHTTKKLARRSVTSDNGLPKDASESTENRTKRRSTRRSVHSDDIVAHTAPQDPSEENTVLSNRPRRRLAQRSRTVDELVSSQHQPRLRARRSHNNDASERSRSPLTASKTAIGVSRVKELSKNKTASSLAPRSRRANDKGDDVMEAKLKKVASSRRLASKKHVQDDCSQSTHSKPAVGMARVKELRKHMKRSSSAPRPNRGGGDDECSYCSSVTPEEVFRAAKIAQEKPAVGMARVKEIKKETKRSLSAPRQGRDVEQACIVTPDEIFQAAKLAMKTPLSSKKPSVGIARVKELNKQKTRSSSAPRTRKSGAGMGDFCYPDLNNAMRRE